MKRKIKIALAVLLLAAVAYCVYAGTSAVALPAKASAAAISDKYDGDCTGHETAGRCADKCANPTDTLQGYDKDTGAAICRSAPTGCPYGDSVPLGPDCDKLAPTQTDPQDSTINEAPTEAVVPASCQGGK